MPEPTQQAILDALQPEKFRGWLETQQLRTFIRRSPCCCPLAEYLTEILEMKGLPINIGHACVHLEDRNIAYLPIWAHTFVKQFDKGRCTPLEALDAALEEVGRAN